MVEGENSGGQGSQEAQEADQVLFSSFETKSVHLDPLNGPLNTPGLDSLLRVCSERLFLLMGR